MYDYDTLHLRVGKSMPFPSMNLENDDKRFQDNLSTLKYAGERAGMGSSIFG